MGDLTDRARERALDPEPFPMGLALGVATLASVTSALPEWMPNWRTRWPVQAAIIGGIGALIALRPEPVAPGTLSDAGTPADLSSRPAQSGTTDQGAAGRPAEPATTAEHDLPSTAQGLDEPEIPWQKVLLPGVVLLAAGAAGGLWLERQLIEFVRNRGVEHPRTAIAVAALPVTLWALRQDLSDEG